MAESRKPQDHKPKTTTLDPETTRRVFVGGREWIVDLTLLDDWDALDIIGEVSANNMTRAPALLRSILGPDQYLRARPLFGRGPGSIEKGGRFLGDLLSAMHEAAAPNS